MKPKKLLILMAVLITVSALGINNAVAQEKMKYEDYLAELEIWRNREEAANTEITRLEGEIAALRSQLADLDRQIADTKNQTWRAMNTTEQGFRQYTNQLNRLQDQIRGLMNLSPGELAQRADEIEALLARADEYAGRDEAKHPDSKRLLSEIRSLLSRLQAAHQRALDSMGPRFDNYSVVRGDHLWKIARKPDIYNDPFQWVKIWTKNRDLVTNPDLIYPGWNLKIYRTFADNDYEVMRGDFLYKIAGNSSVYGDPFKWTQIYEANKGVISDPNVIYPYMILIIPDK
ncbi:MAG: LysM peptidoglycan-binding domain-containing protein [bacterium]|nr:LysM peptidoglycan-binding domain-containing protein [bacterium]